VAYFLMLTEEEKKEITAELAQAERRKPRASRRSRSSRSTAGGCPTRALRDIAPLLDMTPADLDGVATFFNFIYRKPVGRHVIAICDSMVCWTLGYEPLLDLLRGKLGIGSGRQRRTTGSPSCPQPASAPATGRRPCWWMRTSLAR